VLSFTILLCPISWANSSIDNKQVDFATAKYFSSINIDITPSLRKSNNVFLYTYLVNLKEQIIYKTLFASEPIRMADLFEIAEIDCQLTTKKSGEDKNARNGGFSDAKYRLIEKLKYLQKNTDLVFSWEECTYYENDKVKNAIMFLFEENKKALSDNTQIEKLKNDNFRKVDKARRDYINHNMLTFFKQNYKEQYSLRGKRSFVEWFNDKKQNLSDKVYIYITSYCFLDNNITHKEFINRGFISGFNDYFKYKITFDEVLPFCKEFLKEAR